MVKSYDVLGWSWVALNNGNPIASGAAPAAQVQFGDIDGFVANAHAGLTLMPFS